MILPGSIVALFLAGSVASARATSSSPHGFEALARDAEAAHAAGRLAEGAALYRRALALRPAWAEGLWAVGTMAYEGDRWAECRDAFRRLAAVQPRMAAAPALQGLCEFRLGALSSARNHLDRSLGLGLPPQEELGRSVLYHQALLRIRGTAFDLAIAPLRTILQFQGPTASLNVACGLVLLRQAVLPQDVPAADRELVAAAGEAYCASLARHPEQALPLYQALLERYPRQRHLNYGHGLALAQQGSPEAEAAFRREIELFPDDVLALVELGFGLLARGRDAEAVEPAAAAARLAPGLFAAHLVLGRALTGSGERQRGLQELETAAGLAPEIAAVQLALARAYAGAGRKADAERANERFLALQAAARTSAP